MPRVPEPKWDGLNGHQRSYLRALLETRSHGRAATVSGVSRMTAYRWRHRDEVFNEAYKEVRAELATWLEDRVLEVAEGGDVQALLRACQALAGPHWSPRVQHQHGGEVEHQHVKRVVREGSE
jgi:hypothetical protein